MFIAIAFGLPAPLIAIHLLWVNLITDSLPAIALGADKKPDDIMHDSPRDPKESLFSRGGYAITFGYGALIGIATLIAFLIKPIGALSEAGTAFSLNALRDILNSNDGLRKEAQSMAFCVLSFSELFHMLGMTDTKHSVFRVFKDKNLMLWLSFFIGMALQFFVIETPGVNDFFKVYTLHDDPIDYLWVFLLAMTPLLAHEIVVFVNFLKEKLQKKH
jgi:Ca2+-transporting ATPase